MFPSILIVDDNPSIIQSLKGLLTDEGFEVITASNGYEGLKLIDEESPDLVLLDIWMPGIDGIETLKQIKKDNPYIQVIIITGHGNIETAVNAIKLGAYDLIGKPLSIDKIIVTINNALNFRRLEEENRYLRKKTIEKNSVTGNSASITDLKKKIAAVAQSDASVLITGENGTGKELVARSIYQLSPRVDGPFITVDCVTIPEEMMESELFGHEKGAIAGATSKKIGKFELAGNGTIFLDNIGEMTLKTQAKILRVLQEKKFQRLGGSRILDINARFIAASNKSLEQEIVKGSFREDLYHRLNVVPIEVPPLRKRKDDIPFLINTFLAEYKMQNRNEMKMLSPGAIELLCNHSWPGNVRELKNLINQLAIMTDKNIIDVSDIPEQYKPVIKEKTGTSISDPFNIDRLKDAKKAFEKEFIKIKLSENEESVSKTAKKIDVTRNYIHKILNGL
ncbi:sigma-54-dependent transcriptional regulator [Desulfobacterium sp. N47]|uniref:Acetoacetate metabolism regulatory protein atoC n=1 Tax=uncultured Desulfobacterium sp. TaxID=201089 RepID=E1YGP7_9BACT|nr:Acetoacetate metabolism regulatory protein atoC [uncultured Desulfobacterium sp.]